MRTTLRRATVAALAFGTLAGGAFVMAPAAAAASCTDSSKSVDNPGYTGPWPDNWGLKANMCSYRSGGYIYSYAKLSWNDPGTAQSPSLIFDAAAFRVYLKKHDGNGPDPVRYYRTFGIEGRMESGDGSYTTPTIRHAISRWALGDGAWKLNWNQDGKGNRHYGVTASPRV
ncbi:MULTISPECIES: hypothetical protein [Streptomyces]|uniref:Secreted protein n=1 Tax=Streptomyces lycii TaxID=2654337 RepID=A0ABQ7FQ89_9ACTN|nr:MULTISPECIES: hypothetical protein [Streptomyces]KAF4409911.1 hypothetical protein GCU69_06505 [Streptomyces lycii]PGH46687.1 hypothetical protein CRI70_32710 [Streptomyces sp. Ru87]